MTLEASNPPEAPPCYTREWNPLDEENCQHCALQSPCSRQFATRRLDEAARELGLMSPQAASAEKLAQHCGTSVEAIVQARALRLVDPSRPEPLSPSSPRAPSSPELRVSDPQPALPGVLDPLPRSVGAAPVPLPTSVSSASPPVAPKKRGRPPKPKLVEPACSTPPPLPLVAPPPLPSPGPSQGLPLQALEDAMETLESSMEPPLVAPPTAAPVVLDIRPLRPPSAVSRQEWQAISDSIGNHPGRVPGRVRNPASWDARDLLAHLRDQCRVEFATAEEAWAFLSPFFAETKRRFEAAMDPPLVKPGEPVEESENPDGVGFVLNLTTGEFEHAEWPGFPTLFRSPSSDESAPVLQVTYWSQPLGLWVWLVSEPTGRPVPEGAVEVTWKQLVEAGYRQRIGAEPGAALRAVLGR